MTIVLTWFHFKVLIIPLIAAFVFGMSGYILHQEGAPVRSVIGAGSGICIVVWVIVMIGRALWL